MKNQNIFITILFVIIFILISNQLIAKDKIDKNNKNSSQIIKTTRIFKRNYNIIQEKIIKSDPNIEIKLYPNPAIDNVTILLKNNKNNFYELNIYDIKGQKIISNICKNDKKIINLDNFSPGIYFVVIKNNGRLTYYDKFVKK